MWGGERDRELCGCQREVRVCVCVWERECVGAREIELCGCEREVRECVCVSVGERERESYVGARERRERELCGCKREERESVCG